MSRPSCKLILSTLIVLFTLYATACSDPDETRQRHIQSAREHMDSGRYDKARVELKNVLQIDARSADSYYTLGNIEEISQNWNKAIAYYYKTTEISPQMDKAHIRLGHIFLLLAVNSKAGNDAEAEQAFLNKSQEQIDTALGNNKDNVNALFLNASLLYHTGATQEAIAQLVHVLNLEPAYKDAILLLSRLYRQVKMNEESLQVIINGIAISPDETELRIELAEFHAQRRQFDEAIRIMRAIISSEPGDLRHRLSLAAYYSQKEEYGHAEEVFLDAIKYDRSGISRHLAYIEFIKQRKDTQAAVDYILKTINELDNNQELRFRLATLYYETGDYERAGTLLEAIVKQYRIDPIAMRARKKLATIYVSTNKMPMALKLTEEILQENANDYDALFLKGKILLTMQKYKEAIIPFRTALKTQPDSVEAIHLLAESHLKSGDVALASDTFKRAVDISPENIQSRLQLTRFMIAAGEIEPAHQQIKTTLEKEPGNIQAMILETEILLAKRDIGKLTALLGKIKTLAPDSAEAWFRMGRVYKLQQKNELAREEFLLAFEKDPDSLDLLAELTDIELGLGKTTASRDRLVRILESQPDHPAAHKFLGMVYLSESKAAPAEKEFLLHLEQSPDDVSVYIQLANLQFRLKNLNQAAQYYLSGKKLAPDNITILSGLAQIRALQNKYDDTIVLYENILTLQPDDAVTVNNLALLLANVKADTSSLARARELIERSRNRSHPALQDTLGWIHYLEGNHQQAIALLDQAVNKAPEYPTFHYHLGKAYLENGDEALAEKHLKTSLGLGNFPEKDDALLALKTLQSRRAD